jgi:hypothetical protein
MSNEIALSNVQIPAHLAARVGTASVLTQALAGGLSSGESIPRISIKGSRFRIVDGSTETVLDSTTLDVVIVGANPKVSKTWYGKQWTPEAEPSAPECFSLDGINPDPASTEPQNDLCASCPQNAWGSRVTPQGKQIKACSDTKRLAVVAADDPTGSIYLLSVTPAALQGLGQYQKDLAVRGIPAEIVRTKISFDTDASFPKLKFGFGGFLDENTQSEVDKLFGTEQVRTITGELRSTPQPVPQVAAPKAVAKPAPVAEAPAPVAEPVAEPAPVVKGFGAAKAATPAPAPVEKPAAVLPADNAPTSVASLADEIANLIGEVSADDA